MARDGLRSHLSGSVPISIAAHLVVLILLLIIPLAADVALPMPERGLPEFVRAVPAPPPPAFVPASHRVATATPPESVLAPTEAPSTIAPEVARNDPQFDMPIGPPGGLPAGIDDVGAVGSVVATPAPPERPPATVRVAQLPEPPRKIVDARPVYPDIARISHVAGTVIMEAVLDPSGRVTQLRVVRSVPLLDQAALEAVRQWRYTPSIYGGRPVSVLMTITIRFTLNQ